MIAPSLKSTLKRVPLAAGFALLALAPLAALTHAEPADKVAPTLLHRIALDEFRAKTPQSSPLDLDFKAKSPVEFVVRQHDYEVGGHTGWHTHDGPVFIKVTKGTLTVYDYDDEECTGREITAPGTFVDDGSGHIVRNESGAPAQDISIITAVPSGAFRTNLPVRSDCRF